MFDTEKRIALLEQGCEAWRKANQSTLEKHAGHFWAVMEARPLLRAMNGLIECYEKTGRRGEAISRMQEILRLNENDNQGIRYRLVPLLLSTGRSNEATEILSKYPEDTGAWLYLKAFVEFMRGGSQSPSAQQAIRKALKFNPHVIEFLDPETTPIYPQRYTVGSREEAAIIVDEQGELWRESRSFMNHLLSCAQQQIMMQERKARQNKLQRKQSSRKKQR